MEIQKGFFGISTLICEISLYLGTDASVLSSVEAPDTFWAGYAWIAGAAKWDDGSILICIDTKVKMMIQLLNYYFTD